MSKPYVSLPSEQASWTRQQVEEWLNTRTPEQVFGADLMEQYAKRYVADRNLVPAGQEPVEARFPAALLPALGVVADRKHGDDPKRYATACVHAKAGTLYATDLKLVMSVAAGATLTKGKTPPIDRGVIPKADGRTRISFGAGPLLKLVLSALASCDDGIDVKSLGRIDLYLDPEKPAEKIVRVEVVDGAGDDGGKVRLVGAIMPFEVRDEPVDDLKLRPEASAPLAEKVADL